MLPRCCELVDEIPMQFTRTAQICALAACVFAWGCGISPWEQGVAGTESDEAAERVFACDAANFAEYRDQRESGLLMRHGMLHMEHPTERNGPLGGRSCVLVRTSSASLQAKILDVIGGKYPINTGFVATFALGRTSLVTLEKIDGDGKVLSTETERAAFVEIVR